MNAFQHKLINQSGLFNEADKKALEHLFLIISSRESDPIFPHYLPDLAVACLALESISTNNQCLIYPQGLQVLIRESHQNYAIISGKKKHGSISAEKYPTFKLLLEESDKRPSFIQMLTRLMVWDWVLSLNFQPTSKGKVVKALLQDNQLIDFTIKASEFLDSTQLCLDQSFLLLVGKLRNWCRNAQKTKIEKYTADTLTKFINALFKRYEEIKQSDFKSVYDQLPTLTDSKNTEDQPISIDLRNLRRTTSSPTETKKQDELEDDPLEPPSIESIPNDILKKSSRYQNGYAKTAIHRTSQQAQFLDNANQVLTELESQHFFDKLLHDSSDVATQILITFCTGSEPMFWCDWKLHQSEHTEWVDIKNGIWGTPVFIGDKNLIPEPEVAQLFQPTQPVFARPIPQELNDRLNALCKPNNSTLGELFTGTAIEISETCDQWIKQNNPFGRNISLARIRNHLYHQIMLQSFDEAKATHIIGQRVHKIPQSLTYTTFSTEDLISSYQKALPQLNFSYTKIDKTFIGSKAFIKEAEIVTLLEEIANRCIASKKTLTKNPILNTQYLIEFHNQFVSYITLFGLIITSHRPTKDPFARVIDFVFDINATLICDKIVDEKHLSRVCFFDDNFKKQVLTYIEHLKQLQKIFSPKEESDPANSLESIFDINNSTVPFLFFLHKVENSVIVESVQPLSLRNQLSTINSLWESIPLNFGRHYLASKLRTLNVNPEYINYQLGHISAGEEPYGSNSTLSPKIVSKTLQPALTKISTYLNLKPLIGLDDLTKIVISDPIEKVICPTISLAPISRIEKYQETAKEELAIALDIYNTKIRWLDNDFDNALFQTIANDAIQQVIKRSRLRVVENLRFISTCLKEKAKIHNWHFEAPINLLKIDIEIGRAHV